MSLEQGFIWLGQSAPGQFLKDSTVAFAVVESFHILGLAILGGAVLITDLAALGVLVRRVPAGDVARSLTPVFWSGLVAMAVSGVLLVSAGPFKYYTNPLFPWKLGLLAVALIVQVALQLRLARCGASTLEINALAAGSLALWLTVAILGRWLGLI
jgi:hypothetical protein